MQLNNSSNKNTNMHNVLSNWMTEALPASNNVKNLAVGSIGIETQDTVPVSVTGRQAMDIMIPTSESLLKTHPTVRESSSLPHANVVKKPKKKKAHSNKTPFTKIQPKDGDCIVHCGHTTVRPIHFWGGDNDVFVRPDGSQGHAQWFVCCDPCFQKANGNGGKVEYRGDSTWIGDEPAIREP